MDDELTNDDYLSSIGHTEASRYTKNDWLIFHSDECSFSLELNEFRDFESHGDKINIEPLF